MPFCGTLLKSVITVYVKLLRSLLKLSHQMFQYRRTLPDMHGEYGKPKRGA